MNKQEDKQKVVETQISNLEDFVAKTTGKISRVKGDLAQELPSNTFYKIVEIHENKILAYITDASIGNIYSVIDNVEFKHIMFVEVSKIEANGLVTLFPLGATTSLSLSCMISHPLGNYGVKVGSYLKGKVLDGFGNVIHQVTEGDSEDSEDDSEFIALTNSLEVPIAFKRKIIDKQFITGVRAIDMMTPCGFGQRLVICAQPGVGKSTLINMIAQSDQMDIVIINLIGERGREVNEFFRGLNPKVLAKSIFIISTSDKPYIEQIKSLYTSHIIASWFRDKGLNVLLLVDSATRFARALREVSLAAGSIVVRGYTSSVFAAIPKILEMSGTAEHGSITSLYTALFEADSLSTDPLVEELKSVTDGHIVLSRKIATSGRYPAVNFQESISRIADLIVSKEHLNLMRKIIEIYFAYSDYELLIKLGEYEMGSNEEIDAVIDKYKKLNEFFSQSEFENYSSSYRLISELRDILEE